MSEQPTTAEILTATRHAAALSTPDLPEQPARPTTSDDTDSDRTVTGET